MTHLHQSRKRNLKLKNKLLRQMLTKVLLSLKKRWLSLRLIVKKRRNKRKKLKVPKRARLNV